MPESTSTDDHAGQLKELRAAFEARGIELGAPASAELLQDIEVRLGLSLSPDYRALYSELNGFLSEDEKSWICLWPLTRVAEHIDFATRRGSSTFMAIGDMLLDSDFVMADLQDGSSSIFLLNENRVLGASFSEFLSQLSAGAFDWR
jgi:hypothetical protein